MSALYQVRDLRFSYRLGRQTVSALNGLSFEIVKGSLVCLSGPSGSGKSTLLNLLGLIEEVKEGDVSLADKSFKGLTESEKTKIRKFDIGFVFQNFHLFPVLTAEENVEFFLTRQGIERSERRSRVEEALRAVGLWEHRIKKPLEMSGGQRQRVAVARAIAKKPMVILADEPTASLDQKTGEDLMTLLQAINSHEHVTIVVSSHDTMVQKACRQHLYLRDGVLA